ncbi:MAG: winged helix-turn-helix transcriptional regulator [Nitrososphaeraceae archaeon]
MIRINTNHFLASVSSKESIDRYIGYFPTDKLHTELKYDAIRDFIQRNPGSHLRRIKKELNISMGTVQYQLNRLEKNGIITSSKRGFYRYYFPVAIKGFDREILEILSQDTVSQIIRFIIEKKIPTQIEIAKEVGISHASINWHMQRLIELDVIEEIKDGNYKRYRIIGKHERWVNMLAFMKNYYPSLWNKWSSRITEFFL